MRDAALAVAALAVAVVATPVVFDEAAAADFRSAEQFALGRGLAFDGRHASLPVHPLWTLLLGVGALAGVPVEATAAVLAAAALVASTWAAHRLGESLAGAPGWGWLAAASWLAIPAFRSRMLDGGGAALSVALVAAALVWSFEQRVPRAGPVFGLAVLNGVAALVAPAAILLAVRFLERRWLRRFATVVGAIAAVSAVLALLLFGSVAPTIPAAPSLVPGGGSTPPLGVAGLLLGELRFGLFAIAAALALYAGSLWDDRAVLAATLGLQLALAVVLLPIATGRAGGETQILLAGWSACLLASATCAGLAGASERFARARAACAVLAVAAAALHGAGSGSEPAAREAELGARDLRAAGRFVARFAARDESVESDSARAARDLVQPVRWVAGRRAVGRITGGPTYWIRTGEGTAGGARPPVAPAGSVPLRIFDEAHREDSRSAWVALFGAPGSRLATSGLRTLSVWDLPDAAAVSDELGIGSVSRSDASLYAHPPSGARYLVDSGRRSIVVQFTPGFVDRREVRASDGVTFELRSGGELRYRSLVRPTDPRERVAIRLPESASLDTVDLAFVTLPGPAGDASFDWAIWGSLRILVEGQLARP